MYTSTSLSTFILNLQQKGFPWVKSRYDPNIITKNFQNYEPEIKYNEYKLSSYFPKKRYFLPPLFQGKSVIVPSSESNLFGIDILSDIWMEDIRIKAKKGFSKQSPEELLNDLSSKLEVFRTLKKEHPTDEWTADIVRSTFAFITKEVRPFRLTWIKGILKVIYGDLSQVKGLRWLDISAGWGDRLLAAGLLDMEYLGFDPNLDLIEPHTQMINYINKIKDEKRNIKEVKEGKEEERNIKEGKRNIRVEYIPFEDSSEILKTEEPFDLILSSPPFFDLEIYSKDENQSLSRYSNFNQWLVNFLFRSLEISWNHLRNGGYLVLYVGDLKNMQIAEPMNLFIENNLGMSSYEGVIGIENDIGTVRPCWVWKKIQLGNPVKWKPQIKRSLRTDYPELKL